MKIKKRKKSSKQRRTHGYGSRKKNRGKGNKGGKGMAGSGKKADQKKTRIIKQGRYFGKKGITSKRTKKVKIKKINIRDIEKNLHGFLKSGKAKKTKEGIKLNLSGYKILGEGDTRKKFIIEASSASKSAKEKIEKAEGKIIT